MSSIESSPLTLERGLSSASEPPLDTGRTNMATSLGATVGTPQLTISIGYASEFENLAATWRELETRADPTFFLTWDWIGTWLEFLDTSPYLVVVRDLDKIVGLGLLHPAAIRRRRIFKAKALLLHSTGDSTKDVITIEYNGFLADRDYYEIVQVACIRSLVRGDLGPAWDEFHFDGVTADFEQRARGVNVLTWIYANKPSWAIDLEAVRRSGGSYLESISANTRYQIRRSIRLYKARGPLTYVSARTVEEALAFFDDLKVLHQRYWTSRGEPGGFAYPFFESFHRSLIRQCVSRGTVEIVRVAAGDCVIGYLYNFVHAGWTGQYLSGFNYEADAKLKPGLVCHYLCAEQHQKVNGRTYDFMAGENRYKASLGSPGPDIMHLILQRPRLKFRAEHALRDFKRLSTTILGRQIRNGEARSAASKLEP